MREWERHDLERSVDKNPNGSEEPSQIPPRGERQDLRLLHVSSCVHILELVKEQQKVLVFKRRPGQTVRHFGEISHLPRDATPELANPPLSCADNRAELRQEGCCPES